MARGWSGCRFCKGKSGCDRASRNAVRCSASACKRALTAERSKQREEQPQPAAAKAEQRAEAEELPDGMWVHELKAILGERCCRPSLLSPKRRRSGPRDSYQQEFLVLGKFLEDDGDEADDEDEDDEDVTAPGMFWVTQEDLFQTIEPADVKEALVKRQKQVLNDL